jgi:hypothetical protein
LPERTVGGLLGLPIPLRFRPSFPLRVCNPLSGVWTKYPTHGSRHREPIHLSSRVIAMLQS